MVGVCMVELGQLKTSKLYVLLHCHFLILLLSTILNHFVNILDTMFILGKTATNVNPLCYKLVV